MVQDCIKIFKNTPDMDKMVLDTYTPADGTYLFMQEIDDGFIQKELVEVKLDKKTKLLNITEEVRSRISYFDYNCKLLDMNKPIDPKKIIQSNNFLSFWIKKESLSNGKLTNEIIDNYYEILSNPYKKYSKSKKSTELYAEIEKEVGEVNKSKLIKIKEWIKHNIFNLQFEVSGKDYLKIFFLCDEIDFEKEGKRYIYPNIYNKNDYNIKLNDNILGLPNENMGMNPKKPYLENKNRKFSIPILVDTEQIIVRKKFFDYLWNLASSGKSNIYFDIESNHIYPYDYKTSPSSDFKGYYLRIRKDKNEAAIIDMDFIASYQTQLKKPIVVENVTNINPDKLQGHYYGYITKLYEVRDIVNNELFSELLVPNFFTDINEISIDDNVLKESILISRNVLFNWFYKGYENGVSDVLDRISLKLIKNSISKNLLDKAQHQYNIRIAFLEYFKGGNRKMADLMMEIRHNLSEKINSGVYESIKSDDEYYYAIGQLVRYFISLSKTTKKNHSLFNPFLNIRNDKILKEKLLVFFRKYNYAIEERDLRFNNLYKLVVSYQPEGEINLDYMIAGYISNSLIYEKKEEQ